MVKFRWGTCTPYVGRRPVVRRAVVPLYRRAVVPLCRCAVVRRAVVPLCVVPLCVVPLCRRTVVPS